MHAMHSEGTPLSNLPGYGLGLGSVISSPPENLLQWK
jgi:hypothetical protein